LADDNIKNVSFLNKIFLSFSYPNYRIWFLGQIVSLFGTWMQVTVLAFLLYKLTNSSAYLGILIFVQGLPSLVLMMYGGVIADRMSRRTLMIITQTSMMIVAFILAALTFLNIIQPWHMFLLAALLGVANAFDAPAKQSFILEMVEKHALTNAIALNSTMFNLAMAVGPATGGILYGIIGPGWCFVINGVTFIAIILALLLMKLKKNNIVKNGKSALTDLKDGIKYVLKEPKIRTLILQVGVIGLFGLGLIALFPAWSKKILHRESAVYGFLFFSRAIGMLAGALIIASLGHFKYRGKLLSLGTFLFPIMLIVFAFMRWIPLSMFFIFLNGLFMIFVFMLTNSLLQSISKDEFKGRVMGIFSLSFFGFMPLGALLCGVFADFFGETLTFVVFSTILLGFAIFTFFYYPHIRSSE